MATAKTPTTEDLQLQLEALKTDIATLTETIGDLTRAKGEAVAGSLRDKAEAAKAAGKSHLDEAQLQAMMGVEQAEDFVRRNPAAALGIAAGIGVLFGLLSARR